MNRNVTTPEGAAAGSADTHAAWQSNAEHGLEQLLSDVLQLLFARTVGSAHLDGFLQHVFERLASRKERGDVELGDSARLAPAEAMQHAHRDLILSRAAIDCNLETAYLLKWTMGLEFPKRVARQRF